MRFSEQRLAEPVGLLSIYWEDYIVNDNNGDSNDDDDDDDRWESAGVVLEKLEATYREENDTVAWWEGVVERHYGCGGPPYFSGWLVQDFLGEQPDEAPLGLVTVPLTIEDKGVTEQVRCTDPPPGNLPLQAAVVAGVAGFHVKEGQGGGRNETSVEANYAWGLLMEPRSNIRDSLV